MATKFKKPRKNASWRVERVSGKTPLVRLIAPLAVQRGRDKTMCIAIGSKRLRDIVAILNDLGVEV